eukprot:TRINITY_DN81712_c0_g1_i1.p1 TRINITY_DN81712_c0_g1~~TRINITY_DN81712_c0_g1_i1.p1  ORF type:complete len:486 (+),score=120.63 TRINITY_DN81712_c0_g1_i1:65-1522(+)
MEAAFVVPGGAAAPLWAAAAAAGRSPQQQQQLQQQSASSALRASSAAPSQQTSGNGALLPALGFAAGLGLAAGAASRRRSARLGAALRRHAEGAAGGRGYLNITGFPFPLGPITERRTVRKQIGDGMWTFEQEQSLVNIAVNVRMTVIRLSDGSLWVHNPIAPTEECMALFAELGGEVKYIVLGSAQYEHKIFVPPFSRKFPEAKVYTVGPLFSWPIDLPSALLGIFAAGELKDRDQDTPWADEIEQRVLTPSQRLGFGYSAAECAFFHKPSKSLICTDALVYVPETPPEVLNTSDLEYLGNDRNIVLDLVTLVNWRGSGGVIKEAQEAEAAGLATKSQPDLLRVGWQRDALLALYFGPDGRSLLDPEEAFRSIAGKWVAPPVCYSLVYSGKIREDVLNWYKALCEWDFQQIIPGHFAGAVAGTPADVRTAYEVLEDGVDALQPAEEKGLGLPWPFAQQPPIRYRPSEIQLLTDLKGILQTLKVI